MLSIRGQKIFEKLKVEGSYFSVDNAQTTDVNILNISCTNDIEDNLELWKTRKKIEYEEDVDIDEFITKLPEYYPNLKFGKVAVNQLRCDIEHQHFKTVRMKLYELENVFNEWNGERISGDMFQSKMTPESSETLKRYKEEHTFDVENQMVVASYHIRYTGNIAGRIYFYPDKVTRKCYICSLTTKLPTVSDPKMKI